MAAVVSGVNAGGLLGTSLLVVSLTGHRDPVRDLERRYENKEKTIFNTLFSNSKQINRNQRDYCAPSDFLPELEYFVQ